jgi:hypothetical protein
LKNNGITQKEPFACVWPVPRMEHCMPNRASLGGQRHQQYRRWRTIQVNRRCGALATCNLPAGTNAPNGMASIPTIPNRLYLTTWSEPQGNFLAMAGEFSYRRCR